MAKVVSFETVDYGDSELTELALIAQVLDKMEPKARERILLYLRFRYEREWPL